MLAMDQRISKILQKQSFNNTVQNPAIWYMMACDLKEAADKLCWLDHSGVPVDNEMSRFMAIYQMLLGLSFENLIKGLLIAQGKQITEGNKLKPSFAKHNMSGLLSQLDTNTIQINKEERKLLLGLEKYVVWRGRYPIPKQPDNYMIVMHGSGQHSLEQKLWNRLLDNLLDIGWNVTAKGKRIPFRKKH